MSLQQMLMNDSRVTTSSPVMSTRQPATCMEPVSHINPTVCGIGNACGGEQLADAGALAALQLLPCFWLLLQHGSAAGQAVLKLTTQALLLLVH